MTEKQKQLVADAFSNCMVIGNKINFMKSFTEEEVQLIYAGITEDLFSYRIPHYRVIGFKYPADDLATTSIVRTNRALQDSAIKFAERLQNMVPIEFGGTTSKDYSYVYSDTPVHGRDYSRLDIFRDSSQIPEWKRSKLPFEYSPDKIGQLMFMVGQPGWDKVIEDRIMTTENILYREFSLEDIKKNPRPKFLVGNTQYLDLRKSTAGISSEVNIFYYKGTGVLEFSQTADFFKNDSGVFPCRTTYDLNRFFTIRYPEHETDGLTIYVPEGDKLNRFYLTSILKDYAKGLQVSEDEY